MHFNPPRTALDAFQPYCQLMPKLASDCLTQTSPFRNTAPDRTSAPPIYRHAAPRKPSVEPVDTAGRPCHNGLFYRAGQAPFVRSTLRAAGANGAWSLFLGPLRPQHRETLARLVP